MGTDVDDGRPEGWGQPMPSPAWTRPDETLQGSAWEYHRWHGIDPHCTRCKILYSAWQAAGGGRCPQANVIEELTDRFGAPDAKSGQLHRRKGQLAQCWMWAQTATHEQVYYQAVWTGPGGCWEIAAGRDPRGTSEGRQVELSFGDSPDKPPSQAVVRLVCVLAGLLDD